MSVSVVIVEDDQDVREMLCYALVSVGFDVTSLARLDPDSLARHTSPQLFLIDLRLPGLDGVALAARLRAQGFEDSAIVGMSASSVEVRRALHAGLFEEVLPKPFDLSELVGCVERHTLPNQPSPVPS